MKDNFSIQSKSYAKYRPSYPSSLYGYIRSISTSFDNAWDCGTGNGQVATQLAAMFENVYATDISQAQLDNATQQNNITYSLQPAEETNFPPDFFDVVIVAQAVHWFDFEKFYAEVKRTSKQHAVIVIVGYGLFRCTPQVDALIDNFYNDSIGSYWDVERKYIDEHYKTIPFPFQEIPAPDFEINYEWSFDDLLGYLQTWSAVQHYLKQNQQNPLELISAQLKELWGAAEKTKITFPLILRVGKVHSL